MSDAKAIGEWEIPGLEKLLGNIVDSVDAEMTEEEMSEIKVKEILAVGFASGVRAMRPLMDDAEHKALIFRLIKAVGGNPND